MNQAGVYVHLDAHGHVLYVGQSAVMESRTKTHRSVSAWSHLIADVMELPADDWRKRTSLERELIRELKPAFNTKFKALPTNDDLASFHFVTMPHRFYDTVKKAYGIQLDEVLARFLGVTPEHVVMVRLGMTTVSWAEVSFIAEAHNIAGHRVVEFLTGQIRLMDRVH